MLSGAILGGIFASPSVSSILASIRAVTLPTLKGGKGCLLIVKNYTGDRLNFGMACEMAISEGYHVSMVIVADDCAVARTKGITGARGVAGTVLVHKVAGGAAGAGMDLEAVTILAKTAAKSIGSLGVALEAVTIPGAEVVNDRLIKPNDKGESMMEIGLGIHGEAGMRQCPLLSCNDIADEMLHAIQRYGKEDESGSVVPLYKSGDELIVMVNNLGGISNFEMSLLVRSLIASLEMEAGCMVTRVMVGSFMTSFDMKGASVSIMPLTGDARNVIPYIDAETDAPAWSKIDIWTQPGAPRPSSIEIDEIPADAPATEASYGSSLPPVLIDDFSDVASKILSHCSQAIISAEPLLTKYDTIVGDGDCGMTMERGAKEILQRLELGKLRLDHPSSLFSDLADAVSASMGGTSGILLELFFRKASTSLQQLNSVEEGITSKTLATAFQAGVDAVSFYGGAQQGSRTMLDALFPASAAMFGKDNSAVNVQEAAVAARDGADATAWRMDRAEAGRSNYLAENVLMGTPDPGAVAVAIVMEAMAEIIFLSD
ncbi:hypothetical protein ACHAWU_006509 [Discostella pseudostelligera]|uniref:Dihydroxyacetone kinase n=1 Tax=Discostella pseudostelligera TaxID=259834 RepID=A0ABD3MBU1_9STRA